MLFVQANLDLALPDYMSRIVNTGIQQGGIDSVVPEVIRKTTMENFGRFLDDEGLSAILDEYILVDSGSELPGDLGEMMPGYNGEAVYVLKDGAETGKLEAGFMSLLTASETGMDETVLRQNALRMVAAEYEALGMDMGRIQSDFIMKTGSRMILFHINNRQHNRRTSRCKNCRRNCPENPKRCIQKSREFQRRRI
jgi:ATP-binding cassette subfamily B protein